MIKQSRQAIQLAIDLGCNFFDTAWAYGNGKSDGLLGEALANNSRQARSMPRPKSLRKICNGRPRPSTSTPMSFPRTTSSNTRKRSAEKLQVECIDVLQFHVWDDSWADEPEFRETVARLKRDGWIHSFGLSLNRWEPENGIKALRTGLVDVVQVIYNIFDQAPGGQAFPGLPRIEYRRDCPRSARRRQSGRKNDACKPRFPESDWRARYFGPENLSETIPRVEKLKELVPAGMTLPEMAMRFILADPTVSTTIVGMRKLDHVRQNLALSDALPLDETLLAKLKEHRWDRKPKRWSD